MHFFQPKRFPVCRIYLEVFFQIERTCENLIIKILLVALLIYLIRIG